MKLLILYTANILLWSLGDAFRDKGNKKIGHLLKGLSVGLLIFSPMAFNDNTWGYMAWAVSSYLCLHFSLFDIVYNLVRFGFKGITYHGKTSYWDLILWKFNPPPVAELIGRAIILFTGIMIAIQNL